MECTESEARKKLNEYFDEVDKQYEYLSQSGVEYILSDIPMYYKKAGTLKDDEQRKLELTILKLTKWAVQNVKIGWRDSSRLTSGGGFVFQYLGEALDSACPHFKGKSKVDKIVKNHREHLNKRRSELAKSELHTKNVFPEDHIQTEVEILNSLINELE